jgi:RimJ/RimL family protein N-acetyltransferase
VGVGHHPAGRAADPGLLTVSTDTTEPAESIRDLAPAPLVAAIEAVLGRPLTCDDGDRTLAALAAGRAGRAAIMHLLIGEAGPRLEGYLRAGTTLADALHWVRVVAETDIAPGAERVPDEVGFGDLDDRMRVTLRVVEDRDLEPLYRAATDPDHGFRWRFRGATVSREEFHQLLWAGSFAQFMVVGLDDGERYGLVTSYNAQPDLGHAYVAMYRCSPRRGRGEIVTGMYHFINHLFDSFPFRKLYAEVPAYNEEELGLRQVGVLREEGTLVAHDFHRGQWWDRTTFSVWRQDWDRFAREVVEPYLHPDDRRPR